MHTIFHTKSQFSTTDSATIWKSINIRFGIHIFSTLEIPFMMSVFIEALYPRRNFRCLFSHTKSQFHRGSKMHSPAYFYCSESVLCLSQVNIYRNISKNINCTCATYCRYAQLPFLHKYEAISAFSYPLYYQIGQEVNLATKSKDALMGLWFSRAAILYGEKASKNCAASIKVR